MRFSSNVLFTSKMSAASFLSEEYRYQIETGFDA